MARKNLILGTARGKLGDIVLYRAEGEQRSRTRVTPKNPKTPSQAVQRMVLSTASKITSAYKPIINHSFEGVQVGTKSVRYFMKKTMGALRGAAAAAILGDENPVAAEFLLKGAPSVGLVAGLVVSEGSVPAPSFSLHGINEQTSVAFDTFPMEDVDIALNSQEDYVTELAKLGIKPGDQLTIIYHVMDTSRRVAAFDNESNFAQYVRYARIVFKSELPADAVGETLFINGEETGTYIVKPALVEEAEGTMTFEPSGVNNELMGVLIPAFLPVPEGEASPQRNMAATLIRSVRTDRGWDYSTAEMLPFEQNFNYNNAAFVYPSYMASEGVSLFPSEYYLRQAVAQTI